MTEAMSATPAYAATSSLLCANCTRKAMIVVRLPAVFEPLAYCGEHLPPHLRYLLHE